MTKYKAIKSSHPEYGSFDSKGEMERYCFLRLMQRAGEITILERQVVFDIVINGIKVCRIKPDFRYTLKDGRTIVEDYKGIVLPMARLKFKLLKAVYGVDVVITKKPKEWIF